MRRGREELPASEASVASSTRRNAHKKSTGTGLTAAQQTVRFPDGRAARHAAERDGGATQWSTPQEVLLLQAAAGNRVVAQLLATRETSPPGQPPIAVTRHDARAGETARGEPVIQRIAAGDVNALGQTVFWRIEGMSRRKKGKVVAIGKEGHYEVGFAGGFQFSLPAEQLEFEDTASTTDVGAPPANAPGGEGSSQAETGAESVRGGEGPAETVTGPGDARGAEGPTQTETGPASVQVGEGSGSAAAPPPGPLGNPLYPKTFLGLAKKPGAKKGGQPWIVTLLGEFGQVLATVELAGNAIKPYISKSSAKRVIVAEATRVKSAPALELVPGRELPGGLQAAYTTYVGSWRDEQLALAIAAANPSKKKNPNPKQAAIVKRLREVYTARDKTAPGGAPVQMLRIPLGTTIFFFVDGIKRGMTHLYTQDGGQPGEIRCYLGTAQGAYQRVHTTLEGAEFPFRAHTMVQTSTEVAVPNMGPPYSAERVGYDSVENPFEAGLASRTLKDRDPKLGDTPVYKGVSFASLEDRTRFDGLAEAFHKALDAAFRVVNEGANGTATMATAGFKVLDHEWDKEDRARKEKGKEKGKGRSSEV